MLEEEWSNIPSLTTMIITTIPFNIGIPHAFFFSEM